MEPKPETRFNPDELYASYKQARNRLRKKSPESILILAIDALHKSAHGGVEVMRHYPPWNLLLLVKWALQEADPVSHRRPAATVRDIHDVLNVLHEMGGHVRMPNEYEHLYLFMRHIAFQQFWLQQTAEAEAIARQRLLFCQLPKDHPFQRDFAALTGVSCDDFTELALACVGIFINNPDARSIDRQNFQNLDAEFLRRALDPFLSALSRDFAALYSTLNSDLERSRSIADQLILPSPLVSFPFWRRGGDFIPYSPPLLFRSLEGFIYHALKRDKPTEFPSRFGRVFEQYVRDCLVDAGLEFLDEESLNSFFKTSGKCVDFLVRDGDSNVLIDAKGVEASELGRVSHRAEVVFQSIKTSTGKAIRQGMEVSQRARTSLSANQSPFGNGSTYLFVVTYDSLHLGSSTELEALLGAKVVEKLFDQFGKPLSIPLANIFFVSITEFEYLLALIREKRTTIVEAVKLVQANDAKPSTHKFSFIQHLESFSPPARRLPRLQRAFEDLCDRCESKLSR